MLVDAWLPRAAAAAPDRPAVNALTYAELLREADALARRLAGAGARAGDRVAIALAPGEAFCVALHACLRLGAVAVPVDVRLTDAERGPIIAGAAVVLEGAPSSAPVDVALRDAIDLEATAVVVHTSGTTGAPRPIELTAGNWLWSAVASAVALGLDPHERWLGTLPLSHVGGLSIVLRSAIAATTAIVHERFETERVLAALMAPDGPTVVSLVPTTLVRLLDAGLRRPPALRWALLGGAPIAPTLLERATAAGVPVAATYGLTEACSQVVTLGAPLFCTRIRLDGPDHEIVVSGPTVAPAAGPELRTGDRGAWAADGTLRVIGRLADTIVSGGENVAPGEVERVLEAHPAVLEAAVHGRPDPAWGEAVTATVVVSARVTEAELRAWCGARLAPFKVPKAVVFVAALPRTSSGKLLRRELR